MEPHAGFARRGGAKWESSTTTIGEDVMAKARKKARKAAAKRPAKKARRTTARRTTAKLKGRKVAKPKAKRAKARKQGAIASAVQTVTETFGLHNRLAGRNTFED
jgi:hypothetical protein